MKLCVINTGGTISCVGDPLAPMSAQDFGTASKAILDPIVAEKFPGLAIDYETTLIFPESTTGTLDSTNLQPSDWCLIARFVLDNYAAYDGFVILHGTDSLDFTGAALPFLLNVFDANGFGTAVLSKPVIVTGSQVPMFYRAGGDGALKLNFNTDAFQNFCGAVACAQRGIPEVCVYFDAKLYRGNRVLKINASDFYAFDSPNYPVLAEYGIELDLHPDTMLPGPVSNAVSLDNSEALQAVEDQLAAIEASIDDFPVMQFNAFPAPYNKAEGTAVIARLIEACVGTGIKGLVLEAYGEGNFPSGNPDAPSNGAVYRALHAADGDGVLIVDSTQVIEGSVSGSAYASGAWLPEVGAIGAYDMTSMASLAKSVLLLSAAASHGWSHDDVKRLIQLNLAGEIENVSRLNSRTNTTLLPGQSIAALDGSATLLNDPANGPVLSAEDGTFLWSPFGASAPKQPGRLIMMNDGNLVLYSDQNTPRWSTGTGSDAVAAASVLMLSGSYRHGDLVLAVHDYAGGRTTATLYSQK